MTKKRKTKAEFPPDDDNLPENTNPPIIVKPKVGIFIRDYLIQNRTAGISEIHKYYKDTFREVKTSKRRKRHLATYNSFATYVSKLILMNLIVRTGETSKSDNPKAEALGYPERVFIRLTQKGRRALDYVWSHPLRLYYRPYDWEHEDYSEYIKSDQAKQIPRKNMEDREKELESIISNLQGTLDEGNKSKSLKRLEVLINQIPTEDLDLISGLDEVEPSIEEYREISREGLTPEEYRDEKESAWKGIQESLENLEVNEEELEES